MNEQASCMEKEIFGYTPTAPFANSTTNNNRIRIAFNPDNSEECDSCAKIVSIQICKLYVTKGEEEVSIKPGAYSSTFNYRNECTTDDNWCLDFINGETTPDYQQGSGDGKKNGTSVNAVISDAPRTSGGDSGFKSGSNPDGWEKFRARFYTYCWCMSKDSDECGDWYEGISWEYVKTSEDHSSGRSGTSSILSNEDPPPAETFRAAFDLFNAKKGFVPCS